MGDYYRYFEPPRFEAALPELVQAGGKRYERKRHTVAIVGGGPVGMAMALGLARHGVQSVVLEADDTVCMDSRAACISRRSLEIFDQIGVSGPVLDTALPWTSGTSYWRDQPVFRLEMPMDANQKHPPMVNLEQCYTETCLAEAIAASPHAGLRWQTRLARIDAREDGATLAVDTPQGGYELEADWVVACDGARSVVRQALGLRLEGNQYEGTYIIVDVHLRSTYPTERRAWFDPPTNPGMTILMHKQPGDIWRIDYQLGDDEDPVEAVKPENVLPRVKAHLQWIGERDDWQPVWISTYRANCLTLPRYDHGRVLFAGDAAHLVPIFGVRGMNSGLDDTHNLAWKLAWVAQGLAPRRLLESYSQERVFAARENIRHASKSTEFMAPPSPGFQLMREAVLSLAVTHPRLATLANPRQSSAIHYADSPLNTPDRDAFSAGPAPGAPLPEVPMLIRRQGGSQPGFLTDLLANRFVALYFGRRVPPALVREFGRLANGDLQIALRRIAPQGAEDDGDGLDESGRAWPLYGAEEGTLYLVRPDGHTCARWKQAAPGELGAALSRACAIEPQKEATT